MLKGILFDLDGTLVDSLSVTFNAFNHGISLAGGKKMTPQEILAYFGPGEHSIFAKLVGPEKADQAYEASARYMDENLGNVPLHAGVGDLLDQVKSAGVPVSIFTGRGQETTELILKHHGLLDRFVTIIASEHVDHHKPSPDGIFLAAKRMRLDPSLLMHVGDSPADLAAARGAGSKAIAATWDLLADRSKLKAWDPHHWAESPSQVWDIWKALSE